MAAADLAPWCCLYMHGYGCRSQRGKEGADLRASSRCADETLSSQTAKQSWESSSASPSSVSQAGTEGRLTFLESWTVILFLVWGEKNINPPRMEKKKSSEPEGEWKKDFCLAFSLASTCCSVRSPHMGLLNVIHVQLQPQSPNTIFISKFLSPQTKLIWSISN